VILDLRFTITLVKRSPGFRTPYVVVSGLTSSHFLPVPGQNEPGFRTPYVVVSGLTSSHILPVPGQNEPGFRTPYVVVSGLTVVPFFACPRSERTWISNGMRWSLFVFSELR
jgi:hypothetical protein